jgi:hypothetical protein
MLGMRCQGLAISVPTGGTGQEHSWRLIVDPESGRLGDAEDIQIDPSAYKEFPCHPCGRHGNFLARPAPGRCCLQAVHRLAAHRSPRAAVQLMITALAERAMSLWPNKGEQDSRPPLGSAFAAAAGFIRAG